jgi:hypothetical protein
MAQTIEEKRAKQKEYRTKNKEALAKKAKERLKRRDTRVGFSIRKGLSWTQKEEQFIFDNMESMNIEQMALELSRTYEAVATRKRIILGRRPEKTSKVKKRDRFIGRREREAMEFIQNQRKNSNL